MVGKGSIPFYRNKEAVKDAASLSRSLDAGGGAMATLAQMG